MSDCYKDITYLLDEESYNDSEYQDLFRKRFIKNWDNLVEPYRESFTPNNYQFIFTLAINVLARLWENQLKSMRFGDPNGASSAANGGDDDFAGENFGALRFDKDLRGVNSFLSNQTPYGVSVLRDSFARLHQISMLLSVETVSLPHYFHREQETRTYLLFVCKTGGRRRGSSSWIRLEALTARNEALPVAQGVKGRDRTHHTLKRVEYPAHLG